tara:strand:- start:1110 stop:1970 length:861 start_codon:yes stop_codon:yes gene_type:complete
MLLFWPHVHTNIFLEPFKNFIEQFGTHFGPDNILLNSKIYSTSDVPIFYIFINLLFKSPEYILFLYIIFLYLIFETKFRVNEYPNFNINIFLIFLILILPTIFIIFSSFKLYDGLRLFLYIIPFYCIIPALVIFYLIKNIKFFLNKFLLIFSTLLFIFFIFNFIKITPYQYTYYNIFAGKKENLVNKFEIDYWGISLKELVSSIIKDDYETINGFTNIAVCGLNHDIIKIEFNKYQNFKYKIKDLIYEDYDYVIMNNRPVFKEDDKFITCYEKFKSKSIIDIKRNN